MSYIFGTLVGFHFIPADFSHFTPSHARSIYFPIGVGALDHRTPSGGNLGRRQYIVGMHTANLMIDEQLRCSVMGVPRPAEAPTVSSDAGTTLQIGYQRFSDEVTGEVGPLSAGTPFTGGLNRNWTNIPTLVPGDSIAVEGVASIVAGTVNGDGVASNFLSLRPGDRIAISTDLTRWARIRTITSNSLMTIDDTAMAGVAVTLVARAVSRVSHVEQWLSVSGALPRFVTRVRLGTTSISESTATLALGAAEVSSFTAMPYGSVSVMYNQRMIVAGVEGQEDTVFLSLIGFPERYGGLKFKTEYNEPIVGMFTYRKYVVVLCPDSSYVLQGVADEDYVLDGLEPDIGGFGPAKIAEGVAYVPGRKGMQVFNGAFHRVIPTRRSEWTEEVDATPAAYANGFLAINPNDETVQFYPYVRFYPSVSTGILSVGNVTDIVRARATVWVGQYGVVGAQASGDVRAPEWVNDTQLAGGRIVVSAAYLTPSGGGAGKFFRGNVDGQVWMEDETGTVAHELTTAKIALRHELFGEPGGRRSGGKKLLTLESYVKSESSAWIVRVWPGDEFVYPRLAHQQLREGLFIFSHRVILATPVYQHSVAANGVAYRSPETVHVHPVIDRDGRGFTIEYHFTNPVDVWFMGCGGFWSRHGIATRPQKTVQP